MYYSTAESQSADSHLSLLGSSGENLAIDYEEGYLSLYMYVYICLDTYVHVIIALPIILVLLIILLNQQTMPITITIKTIAVMIIMRRMNVTMVSIMTYEYSEYATAQIYCGAQDRGCNKTRWIYEVNRTSNHKDKVSFVQQMSKGLQMWREPKQASVIFCKPKGRGSF